MEGHRELRKERPQKVANYRKENRKKAVDLLPENEIISSKISEFGKGFKIPDNKTDKKHKGKKLEKNEG